MTSRLRELSDEKWLELTARVPRTTLTPEQVQSVRIAKARMEAGAYFPTTEEFFARKRPRPKIAERMDSAMTENNWNFSIDSSNEESIFVRVERSQGLLSFAILQRTSYDQRNQRSVAKPGARVLAGVGGDAEDAVGLAACLVVAAGEHPSDARPEVAFGERVAELRAAAVAAMPPAMRGKIPAPAISEPAKPSRERGTISDEHLDEIEKDVTNDAARVGRDVVAPLISEIRTWRRRSQATAARPDAALSPEEREFLIADARGRLHRSAVNELSETDRVKDAAIRALCRLLGADPDVAGA